MGSNGKDPATNSSGSSYHVLLPTNNFAELLSFGAVAPQMGLSVGLSHGVVLSVLQRAHVGAPFISHHSTHDLSSTGGQICSQLQPAARPPA